MFCPLMQRFKNVSVIAFAFGLIFAAVSTASAESVPAESASIPAIHGIVSPILPESSAPRNVVRMPAVAAPVVEKAAYRHPVIVLEAPEGVSLDRLRRESASYPDHGMAGRFVELSTELPPLFGTDE